MFYLELSIFICGDNDDPVQTQLKFKKIQAGIIKKKVLL